jgi:hypothetical protein
MKKQTAVEWLIEQIDNKDMGEIPIWIYVICEDAKALEEEQIEGAYKVGYNDCSLGRFSDCEKYYTSTYE